MISWLARRGEPYFKTDGPDGAIMDPDTLRNQDHWNGTVWLDVDNPAPVCAITDAIQLVYSVCHRNGYYKVLYHSCIEITTIFKGKRRSNRC